MMRLIDADALKDLEEMEYIYFRSPATVPFYEAHKVWNVIDNASTIEAEPVRHGRWEECDWVEYDGHSECVRYPKKGRVCTNCRNAFKKEFIDDPRVHYCPHCGAKMDGDNHGNVEM